MRDPRPYCRYNPGLVGYSDLSSTCRISNGACMARAAQAAMSQTPLRFPCHQYRPRHYWFQCSFVVSIRIIQQPTILASEWVVTEYRDTRHIVIPAKAGIHTPKPPSIHRLSEAPCASCPNVARPILGLWDWSPPAQRCPPDDGHLLWRKSRETSK